MRAAIITALVILGAACIVGMIRVEVVHRIRMRRLDAIRGDARELVRFLNGPSLHQCLRDWRKWTYRAFYPDKK